MIDETSSAISSLLPKVYSRELVDVIFQEFYTRISSIEKKLGVTRKTASSYLMQLAAEGFLEVETRGREKIFINKRLIEVIKK